MTLRENILELKSQGKSYNEISTLLDCSKGTISYHCNASVKERVGERRKLWRRKNTLANKLHNFCHPNGYKRKIYGIPKRSPDLILKNLKSKFGDNPRCYITGDPVNLDNPSEYSLDHIIPLSKGGDASLSNCGLTSWKANQVKNDLSYDELIVFCRKTLQHYESKLGSADPDTA